MIVSQRRLRAAENEENERVSLSVNELARVEQNFEDVQRNLHETNQELSTIQRKLENAQSITSRMALIRSEVDRASERAERLQSTAELPEARQKLKRLTDDLRLIDQSLIAVDEKISVCQQNAAQRQEIEALLKDRNTKFETARKIRNRHLESLEHVFGNNTVPAVISDEIIDQEVNRREQRVQPDSGTPPRLRQSFLVQMSRLEQDTRETRKRLAKSEQERSVLETKTKFTRSQLQEKQSRLQKMEERILTAAGSPDLEQCLNRLQQKRKLLEEECANEQGSLYLWRKFRDRLARTDPDCPVCHRHLSDLSEQNELLSELDQRIRSMPDEFARKKLELSDLVTQHETLLELRPISLELERLRSTDLPELESRLTSEQSALEKSRNLSEEETARLESCQADEALAKSVQGDLAVFERIENELIDISVKLKRLQSDGHDMSDAGVDLLGALQEERRTLRAKQSSCSNDITECQERIHRLDEAQREATAELHRVKDALHQLEQENQSNLRLTEDFNRLTELAKSLQSKRIALESSDLPAARRARDLAVDNRTHKAAEREKQLEQSNEKTRKLRDLISQIEQACEAVSSASQLGCESRLEETRERLCTVEGTISHLHSVVDKSLTDLEQARKQLNEHKIRQRELTDCIQLRQLRNQLGQLSIRLQELNDRLRSCHAIVGTDQDLVKETKQLSVAEERLQAEKNALTNQLGQLTAKLQYFSQDLKEKYANADKDFLDMMYQLKTTELACSDLERYYKALDRAIMAYHATKMMDLNKIIRELWRTTYRGNDIDYIEICSEEDSSSAGSSITSNAIRTRRTYNYRVVMVKGTTGGSSAFPVTDRSTKATAARSNEARLDMRGRCSAGQKVLASLIIRLALAEVFCLHCGVLALDEPTTNLDRENIESLAYALVEIIKNRRQQKNFQLIVITHDEDFVELLGRSDYVENFFLLSRNTQGLSEIRKVPIEDHFH
ncbi:hypothetical protein P879_04643 [Paragonimus westermani]|uniref:Zinc-hook domain-containing protein n=1 Tax=Paragonimus westermani TaxID=34504 RepID=A0A8T0DEA4_9TREM|nr:hypothetical protein P879_04643 [Paragonimus westermani]